MSVVCTVERTDDNESGVGIALELFKLANGVIDAEFGRFLAGRNDLKIVKTDNRSFSFVETKRFEPNKKLVNGFVLHF